MYYQGNFISNVLISEALEHIKKDDGVYFFTLAKKMNIDTNRLRVIISVLEIEGAIENVSGRLFLM